MPEAVIRHYRQADSEAVRKISWDTAFIGEPAGAFFEDKEILSDFLTVYFTDYEPESCFVAESAGEAIGYLIGAKDEARVKNIFINKLIVRLIFKAARRLTLFKPKNISFLCHCLLSYLKGEFRQPDFSKDYPAVLHVNLKLGFRNLGIGSRLINAFEEYLKAENVSALHLCTMSESAGQFFIGKGFELLFRAKKSYFRYITGREINIYIYGKKL